MAVSNAFPLKWICERALSACIIFAFCSHVYSQEDPWAGDVHTVILDADNLTAFVSNTKLCMVEFYTPWVTLKHPLSLIVPEYNLSEAVWTLPRICQRLRESS